MADVTRRAVVLLSLLAASCSRKSEEEAPKQADLPLKNPVREQVPSELPPVPQLDDRPKIVAFGDSLTAGYGADPGKSFPDYLQKDLDQAGYRYQVINCGISGNTSSDGVARIDQGLSFHPEIVILELGGNDGLRGISVSLTRQNLEQMIEAFQKAGAKVLLAGITLPRNYGPDYIAKFEQNYTDLAKKYKIPLFPFLLEGVYGTDGMMQADGIHATAAGNEIVARNVLKALKPLLRGKEGRSAAR